MIYNKGILIVFFLLAIFECSIFASSTDIININELLSDNSKNIGSDNENDFEITPRALAATKNNSVVSTSTVNTTIQYKQVFYHH